MSRKRKCIGVSILLRYDMSLDNHISAFPDNTVASSSWVKMPKKDYRQKKKCFAFYMYFSSSFINFQHLYLLGYIYIYIYIYIHTHTHTHLILHYSFYDMFWLWDITWELHVKGLYKICEHMLSLKSATHVCLRIQYIVALDTDWLV